MPVIVALAPLDCGAAACSWDDLKPFVYAATAAVLLLCLILASVKR